MKHYTKEHEWIEESGDGRCRVGVTDFAQEQLGDVVSVELPETGATLAAGAECAVIESVKAASDIFAPVPGEVLAVNDALADNPALINESPESDGWLWEMSFAGPEAFADMMDEKAYREFAAGEH